MVDTVNAIMENSTKTGFEIAAIGMSGRFPGARNIDEFWINLKNGVESIAFFSKQELEESGVDPGLIDLPTYVGARGVLQDAECFDSVFFDYTAREAKLMDPQVRLFHECAWESLENAGYDPGGYNEKIGLYAGASDNFNWQALSMLSGDGDILDPFSFFQLRSRDFLTTRLSFKFNLRGPSFFVQTACSTALVAIHLACQGLLSGECSMALAGGVSVNIPQNIGYLYREGMVVSPDGHCRAFDADAKGFCGGHGAGAVVLKLLEDAVRDGDHIYALVKGSAVNNDGNRKAGFTAPSIKAQAEAIKAALNMAEVEPESIGYIENHGTGTQLGDPIEIEALKQAFNIKRKGGCKIGSVKTNIGHLDAAAGVAGFIKTVLMLVHRQVPPSLHFKTPNRKIDFKHSPFTVNTILTDWENGTYPLRAGVSSFGIGGTNAHLVLEEWPGISTSGAVCTARAGGREYRLIPLSARTSSALDVMTRNLAAYLEGNPGINLADAAFTLQAGRKPMRHRRMIVASTINEAASQLANAPGLPYREAAGDKPRVVFMFPGLGAQYVDMGLDLYKKLPEFREEMDRCFNTLAPLVDYDLKEILYPSAGPPGVSTVKNRSLPGINRVEIAQAAVFVLEYALARLLIKWGIKPDAMIGYSFGEYTAACISGVFSLADVLELIVSRGRLLAEVTGGAMLSVPLSREELMPLPDKELSLAVDNGSSCIVAGCDVAISSFEKQLKSKKLMCMPVPHSVAMHSGMMDPILNRFKEKLEKITLNPPGIPYISNVTGTWTSVEEVATPSYWTDHLRKTVRFAGGLNELMKKEHSIFVEIGPSRDLCTIAQRFIEGKPGQKLLNLIPPPGKKAAGVYYLLNKIGYLWLSGVNINWPAFYPGEKRRRIPLPTYPFEGCRHRLDTNLSLLAQQLAGKKPAIIDEANELSTILEAKPVKNESAVPRLQRSALSTDYAPPGNELQEIMVDIWEQFFGTGPIGILDDFFELGGDSLKAMNVSAIIQKKLKVEIPAAEFFNRQTIEGLADYIRLDSENSGDVTIEAVEKREYYPVSSAERRLYALQQRREENTGYNEPLIMMLEGNLEKEKLQNAFNRLIERHESLRTSFVIIDGELVQKIHDKYDSRFEVNFLQAQETVIEDTLINFIIPFNLAEIPLVRVGLIEIDKKPGRFVLIVDMHHIVTDGISKNIMIENFAALYKEKALPELRVQYKDFSRWQNDLLLSGKMKKQEEYWLKEFDHGVPALNLPVDYPRPPVLSFEGNRIVDTIGGKEVAELKKIASERDTTLYMVFLAIFYIFLSRLSGQEDIVCGSLIHGRRYLELQEIVGMFVNTLALRNTVPSGMTFNEFLKTIRLKTLNTYENQDYQFETLVEKVVKNRDIGRNPLFDVMFIFLNYDLPVIDMPALTLKPYQIRHMTTMFDFRLDCAERGTEISLRFEYSTRLFKQKTIERLVGYFKMLISAVIENPFAPLGDLEIIPREEKKYLLYRFNDTDTVYPVDKTLHELFERQATKTPDYIALRCPQPLKNNIEITYGKLNRTSDRMAYVLRQEGVGPGTIAAIMMNRSEEAVIGILGILKAGGAYLPVDPDYPEERINFILADSSAKILVNNVYTDTRASRIRASSTVPLLCSRSSTQFDPAYIIYTSGSTGRSKGVIVEHRNIVNYTWWAIKKYVQTDNVDFPLFTSLSFDLTVTSIFTPLLSGNTIVVYEVEGKESPVKEVIEGNLTGAVKLTPSHLKLILELFKGKLQSSIKRFVVGGEKLETQTALKIAEKFNNDIVIYNEYGPTEATVGCMIHAFVPETDSQAAVPIGIPADNVQVYILDKNKKPVPVGTASELYISGVGVARGYLNRPELTAERFIKNSFLPGKRMYKTGDLVRFQDEGNIQFLGRIDQQIKIRGYRIEPGEIESKLKEYGKNKLVSVPGKSFKRIEPAEHQLCQRCLLPANYPGIHFDEKGVCNICLEFDDYKDNVKRYFKGREDFLSLVEEVRETKRGEYDCLLLYSGGKDSTYVLYRLIDMDLKVLTFTFDNGYISDAAFTNIKRTTSVLKVKNIVAHAENMNRVFVESLNTDHDVCHGCWNALNTYGAKAAYENGISLVISGLSRGQIFEMRLEGLFKQGIFTEEEIEENLRLFRESFHSGQNRFARLLGVELAEEVLDRIYFTDFFRYFDVPVADIRDYLAKKGWVQPEDTGFCSSNCMINDVGIYVHLQKKGYHFYAPQLSWDCRLGSIPREVGLKDIVFDGDGRQIYRILKEIGYYRSTVEDAVVVDREDKNGNKTLIAYLLANREPAVSQLREYLAGQIPGYMIPAHFTVLEKFPLTGSGKIDRKALQERAQGSEPTKINDNTVPPGNEIEKRLVETWQEVLAIKGIGITDNFFAIGGDSIKAIQITSRLLKHGMKLKIGDLFNHPTIKKLATYVEGIKRKPEQETITGKVELTPIQKWFFENKFTSANHFNQAVMLYKETGFAAGRIEEAFSKITRHHDALRMVYKEENGNILQENRGIEGELFHLEVVALEENDKQLPTYIQNKADKVQQSIDLETGPLVKLCLFKTINGEHLLIVIHHLVIDGVSWRILLEDFSSLYEGLEKGEDVTLQDKTDSFQYWADKQKQYAESKTMHMELKYWKNILENIKSILPGDARVNRRLHKDCDIFRLDFSRQQTKKLLEQTNHAYNTESSDLLLTALALCFHKMWGVTKIPVTLEGHGREEIGDDVNISRTIGWFTTQFPVLLDLSGHDDLSYRIRCIKEGLRKIPNKGIGFGILKYLSRNRQELSSYEYPEIRFNYLGDFDVGNRGGITRFSHLGTGAVVSPGMEQPYALDINGILAGGKLSFAFTYNKNEYKRTTIKQLAGFYKVALSDIITHCAAVKETQATPWDYGAGNLGLSDLDKIKAIYGDRRQIEKIYGLSPMQEGILFHRLLDETSTAYFEQFTINLEGNLVPSILEKSINRLIDRYDILRTSFIYEGTQLSVQVVLKERDIKILYRDIAYKSEEEQNVCIADYRQRNKTKGFHLTQHPLMRFALFKTRECSHILIWSYHHILMDGWSFGILWAELLAIYKSLLQKESIVLEPVIPYKNYIDWLEHQDKEKGLLYWQDYLQGFDRQMTLPGWAIQSRESESPYDLKEYDFEIDEATTSLLNSIAGTHQVTVNTLMQTAWAILLQRYNHTDDVVFGAVVSGRTFEIEGIEKMLGLFINTVPVRVTIKDSQTFTEVIKEVQRHVVESQSFEYLSLAETQSRSILKGDLINHIVIFENYPIDEELKKMTVWETVDFNIKRMEAWEQTNYDFNIFITPANRLHIKFSFNSRVYDENAAERTAGHWRQVLEEITAKKDRQIRDIDILTPGERLQLLVRFNDTGADYPREKTITGLFAEQVRKRPGKIAVRGENCVSYEELNREANRLAYDLIENHDIQPGDPVGLMIDHDDAALTGMLGILKAGGAYVPIDPAYPRERIAYILEDVKTKTIITTPAYVDQCEEFKWEIGSLKSYIPIGRGINGRNDFSHWEQEEQESRRLWNYTARQASNDYAVAGWINSRTKEVFPGNDMREFIENVAVKLKPHLKPGMKVLEVGAGSGMIMSAIAPLADKYYCTDISDRLIEKCRQRAAREGLKNIELERLQAEHIDCLQERDFNVIIINSVVQYFPSLRYLRDFLAKALDLLSDEGILFIGDIRDKELQLDYYGFLYEGSGPRDIETRILNKKRNESELFLPRDFFVEYFSRFAYPIDVQFSSKIGKIKNELSLFRYDALIRVKKSFATKTPTGKDTGKAVSDQHLNVPIASNNPAYIIYTSGSTGKPKGVMIEHGNVAAFNLNLEKRFGIQPGDIIYGLTTYTFDISVLETICSLLSGASVVVESSPDDPAAIPSRIINEHISVLQVTPSRLQWLIESVGTSFLEGIRILLIGGEPLPRQLFEKIRPLPISRVYNVYGPTEATIWSSACPLDNAKFSIGKPLLNEAIYILSGLHELVPVGVPGQLHIGGSGLARGYLNNPELTKEKFVLAHSSLLIADRKVRKTNVTPGGFGKFPMSYELSAISYIYKTGDLARWLSDGNIEFLGRMDQQVKIRGFRIELGEIEHQLAGHPHITEAVVTGGEELIAYVVSSPDLGQGAILNIEELRTFLGRFLPGYMIPSRFIRLKEFPLTVNGKIDRKALTGMHEERLQLTVSQKDEAPVDQTGKKLLHIWQEVLGIEKIGVNDNFFHLGGHSLKATQLVSRIYKKLSIEIRLGDIFAVPTIAGLAKLVGKKMVTKFMEVHPVPKREYYDISHAQRRLWVLNRFEKESVSYNMPAAFTFIGRLNIDVLKEVFQRLMERHYVLRTCFITVKGTPVQVIHESPDIPLEILPAVSRDVESLVKQHAVMVFDLSRAPLFSVRLLRLAEKKHILLFNIHHIISDAWSTNIFVNELVTLYNALSGLEDPDKEAPEFLLPPLKIQYKDYASWQNALLSSDLAAGQKKYWQRKLGGKIPVLDIPADFPRPVVKTNNGSSLKWTLDERLTADLNLLCRKHDATLFMVLSAAVNLLLYRYTNREDILIGSPIAGRNHPDLEDQIGFYVNTLVLRSRLRGDESFADFLRQVRQTTTEAYDNQLYPFDKLVDQLNLERDTGRHPLFDIMVVLQPPRQNELKFDTLEILPLETPRGTSKFDMNFIFWESREKIFMEIEYNTDLFREDRIRRLGVHFQRLLQSIAQDPGADVQDLNILTRAEKHRLLVEFNDTTADYSKNKTIIQLFEDQVEKTPDKIAVVDAWEGTWQLEPDPGTASNLHLTYRELSQNVDWLAYNLVKNYSIRTGDLVGLMVDRDDGIIIAVMGILKSGSAYVPIDGQYPTERVKYILSDGNCKILLAAGKYIERVKRASARPVVDLQCLRHYPVPSPLPPLPGARVSTAGGLTAYVLYTSGSTGKPKGVLMGHTPLVNLIQWLHRCCPPGETGVVLLQNPFTFDMSVWGLFAWSFYGAASCLLEPGAEKDPGQIINAVYKHNITVLHFVPSMLRMLLEYMDRDRDGPKLLSLEHIFVSGETLDMELVEKFAEKFGTIGRGRLYNLYGPTETHVVSYFDCKDLEQENYFSIPIGKPIANTRLYILAGSTMRLLPVGIPGEIYIGGVCLAAGYLNRPGLTAEKFILLDKKKKGQKKEKKGTGREYVYRSGDLGRWLANGNIEFLGRKDQQIKIRGIRVEPGEIEAVLSSYPGVQESVVVVKEVQPGDKRLIGYAVSRDLPTPGSSMLQDFLKKKLPDYMVPSAVVILQSLPLTANGKIDRKALPSPSPTASGAGSKNGFTSPRSGLEQTIAAIWQEVLQVENVGIHDNFFDIGGNSLHIIQVHSNLLEIFNDKILIVDLFRCPTISLLAQYLNQNYGKTGTAAAGMPETFFKPIHSRAEKQKQAKKQRKRINKIPGRRNNG